MNGKIYKIVDNTNNNIYIGSTCESTLTKRLSKHKSDYKRYVDKSIKYTTSFEIIKNDGKEKSKFDFVKIYKIRDGLKVEIYSRPVHLGTGIF